MQKYLKVLIAGWLLVGAAAHAGVVTGGTRLIYPGGKKESSLSVTNNDATPYLIQSWVESNKGAALFLLTPPLFRLEGEQQTRLRVIYSGGLPENKESMFWMNIKAIPSSQAKAGANTLQIAIKTRIKLIYRPKSVQGTPGDGDGAASLDAQRQYATGHESHRLLYEFCRGQSGGRRS